MESELESGAFLRFNPARSLDYVPLAQDLRSMQQVLDENDVDGGGDTAEAMDRA